MGIADSMKDTAENIIASYEARVKGLGELVADTRETVEGFTADREKMAKEQAKSLANFVENLAQDVGSMLKGFEKEHSKMSEELKASLAKETRDIEDYVAKRLKGFKKDRTDMSKRLKADLSAYVSGIASETETLLENARKTLNGYQKERRKMAANWQSMAATLAKKRGLKPEAKAEVKVRPVTKAVREIKAEEVPAGASVEEKIAIIINKNPKGLKASDIAEVVGIPRTRVGVVVKKLVEAGQVRKEENLYFPLK